MSEEYPNVPIRYGLAGALRARSENLLKRSTRTAERIDARACAREVDRNAPDDNDRTRTMERAGDGPQDRLGAIPRGRQGLGRTKASC